MNPDAYRDRDKNIFNIRNLILTRRLSRFALIVSRCHLRDHQPGEQAHQRGGGDRENNETAKHDNALFFHQSFLFRARVLAEAHCISILKP